jgi:hypothetical protein
MIGSPGRRPLTEGATALEVHATRLDQALADTLASDHASTSQRLGLPRSLGQTRPPT